MLYRFEYEGLGIYEAVDKFCRRDDPRRQNKPDGSWLPKVGLHFPSAKSLWTETGLRKYQSSGLLAWHLSVLPGEATTVYCTLIDNERYRDAFQVIAESDAIQILEIITATEYLSSRSS